MIRYWTSYFLVSLCFLESPVFCNIYCLDSLYKALDICDLKQHLFPICHNAWFSSAFSVSSSIFPLLESGPRPLSALSSSCPFKALLTDVGTQAHCFAISKFLVRNTKRFSCLHTVTHLFQCLPFDHCNYRCTGTWSADQAKIEPFLLLNYLFLTSERA